MCVCVSECVSTAVAVMTDLQDVVDGIGQQFAVLRMHVTRMTPTVSQSDDILFLMSIVSIA